MISVARCGWGDINRFNINGYLSRREGIDVILRSLGSAVGVKDKGCPACGTDIRTKTSRTTGPAGVDAGCDDAPSQQPSANGQYGEKKSQKGQSPKQVQEEPASGSREEEQQRC